VPTIGFGYENEFGRAELHKNAESARSYEGSRKAPFCLMPWDNDPIARQHLQLYGHDFCRSPHGDRHRFFRKIIQDDGYTPLASADHLHAGDIVVYAADGEFTHVALVVREGLVAGIVEERDLTDRVQMALPVFPIKGEGTYRVVTLCSDSTEGEFVEVGRAYIDVSFAPPPQAPTVNESTTVQFNVPIPPNAH
jgi:hypothetical protein